MLMSALPAAQTPPAGALILLISSAYPHPAVPVMARTHSEQGSAVHIHTSSWLSARRGLAPNLSLPLLGSIFKTGTRSLVTTILNAFLWSDWLLQAACSWPTAWAATLAHASAAEL